MEGCNGKSSRYAEIRLIPPLELNERLRPLDNPIERERSYEKISDCMPEQAISRVQFSVSVTFYGTTIIHLRVLVTQYLSRPTQKLGRAALKRFPIRSCSRWGLPSFLGHPRNWCALTAPFHPYPVKWAEPKSHRAVSFLWHFPSRCRASELRSTLPFGARTFLSHQKKQRHERSFGLL